MTEPRIIGPAAPTGTAIEVFVAFLRLGLTSFGGPIAHLGYYRADIVARRGWLDEHAYADLVALCQFLPGPASSQVGIGIGLTRAGYTGALAAWLAFTILAVLAGAAGEAAGPGRARRRQRRRRRPAARRAL